jgi:hypothetical protein
MGEDKKSFMDELSKLAEITNIVEESFLSEGKVSLVVELPEEEYTKAISHFREIDRTKNKFTISISDVDFNFVLSR